MNRSLEAIKPRIAPPGRNATNNRKENSMEPQEKIGMEPEEIEIVELGSASELIQSNSPKGAREFAVSPGYWALPLAIYEDEQD
jgi:hypothetical protein